MQIYRVFLSYVCLPQSVLKNLYKFDRCSTYAVFNLTGFTGINILTMTGSKEPTPEKFRRRSLKRSTCLLMPIANHAGDVSDVALAGGIRAVYHRGVKR